VGREVTVPVPFRKIFPQRHTRSVSSSQSGIPGLSSQHGSNTYAIELPRPRVGSFFRFLLAFVTWVRFFAASFPGPHFRDGFVRKGVSVSSPQSRNEANFRGSFFQKYYSDALAGCGRRSGTKPIWGSSFQEYDPPAPLP
jgi:hypothetical protein